MPYIIKEAKEKGKKGYKVCKRDEPARCFSKHPLTEEKATKQRTAIIMSEMGISQQRGGNSEEWPPVKELTIAKIKEHLIANGYSDIVTDPANSKKLKAWWIKTYEEAKEKGTINQDIRGVMVADANEAFEHFRRMNINDRSPPHSPPSQPSRRSPPRPSAPSRMTALQIAASLPLPPRKPKSG